MRMIIIAIIVTYTISCLAVEDVFSYTFHKIYIAPLSSVFWIFSQFLCLITKPKKTFRHYRKYWREKTYKHCVRIVTKIDDEKRREKEKRS